MKVSLVLNWQHPGRHALNVLAGAVEAARFGSEVALWFPRSLDVLVRTARRCADAGDTVVAAWSFYSPGFDAATEELAAFRARLRGRDVLCVAGGAHATAKPAETLGAGFDLVAVGEGERTIVDLLRRLLAGRPAQATRGFACREAGRVRRNGRGETVDLDEWPPFAAEHGRFGAIETTRGCVYACRFCETSFLAKGRFRHRSVANVCHWVRALRETGRRDVRFLTPSSLSYGSADESVCLDRVEELLARVREVAGPAGRLYYGTFPSELRPEHVSADALSLLRRYADNDNVVIGGQSGSDRMLERCHRGHDREAVVRAVRLALEGGFVANVDVMFGLPGETADDRQATVDLVRELAERGARVHAHAFLPLPGTAWAGELPGEVDGPTRRLLDRLASQGRVYGQWKRQAFLGRALARQRAETPPGSSPVDEASRS